MIDPLKIAELHNKGVSAAGITSLLIQQGLQPLGTNYQGVLKLVRKEITTLKSGKSAEGGKT